MKPTVCLYSKNKDELQKFLSSFYSHEISINNDLKYQIYFNNPTEMCDIISAFSENMDKYNIALWISFDDKIYIYVNKYNSNQLIKYIFERFPY